MKLENEEMLQEAQKIIHLRDSLLKKDTSEVRRLKIEKRIRDKYAQTSKYKKYLKSGRIDLIDKESRTSLFTPYEVLHKAHDDYYKPRKQREDPVKEEPRPQPTVPPTNANFYDDEQQPEPYQSVPVQQAALVSPPQPPPPPPQPYPFAGLQQHQQLPYTTIPPQQQQFPLAWNQYAMMAQFNPFASLSGMAAPTTGYLPSVNMFTPSQPFTSMAVPSINGLQPNNSAYLGTPPAANQTDQSQQQQAKSPPAPPPPASYNPFNVLQDHSNFDY